MTGARSNVEKLLATIDGLLPEMESTYNEIHADPELSVRCRPRMAVRMIPIDIEHHLSTMLSGFDLPGTFVFALSGATKAVQHKADLFRVLAPM